MKKGELKRYLESGAGIPLVLDSYDDIFSDFDARSYSEKALSGDFLSECKKASADKDGKIRLRLFLPRKKRDLPEEIKIKKRFKEHFNKHFKKRRSEIRKIKLGGTLWAIVGAALMVVSAFFFTTPSTFLMHLFAVLIQPAGWFFLWEGMAKILITPKEKLPEYHFYRKMSNSEISFANLQ